MENFDWNNSCNIFEIIENIFITLICIKGEVMKKGTLIGVIVKSVFMERSSH